MPVLLPSNRLISMRKGQGLPISTIIIAALGILVLVVLGYVFAQKTSAAGKEITKAGENKCEGDYERKPIGTSCDVVYGSFKELGTNEICCKKDTVRTP